MGMFDRVIASCPKCGRDVEFQTKAGPCTLETYRANEGVPLAVADDLRYAKEYCFCGIEVRLDPLPTAPQYVPMVPVKVD